MGGSYSLVPVAIDQAGGWHNRYEESEPWANPLPTQSLPTGSIRSCPFFDEDGF